MLRFVVVAARLRGGQTSPMDLLRQKRTLPGSRGLLYFRSETVLGCNG